MFAVAAEQELYRSCEIIFGLDLAINRDFLEYLRPSGLKVAYRRRALETHPDRAASRGGAAQEHGASLFRAVQEAYENLRVYLDAREKGFRLPGQPTVRIRAAEPAASSGAGRQWRTATQARSFRARGTEGGVNGGRHEGAKKAGRQETRFNGNNGASRGGPERVRTGIRTTGGFCYAGTIPNRKLLLGHFLYYSGIINWRTIVQALVWQRAQRPKLGEIARLLGWLTNDDILFILQKRSILQPFGESAMRFGLLTERQLNTIILRQKRLQKKFGAYFTEHAILTQGQLDEYVRRCRLHNARFESDMRPASSY